MKRHVALVGFMASGKSTIGRKLAKRLGWTFVDTDDVIAREHGPIAAIFAAEGEPAFRRYEHGAISAAVNSSESSVIALGGGALTFGPNQPLLRRRAYRIFIKVSAEQVLARVRKSREKRPLLGAQPTLASVRALYEARMPQYVQADYVVEAERRSGRDVLDDILKWMRTRRITLT
jgi:shikimate kinase